MYNSALIYDEFNSELKKYGLENEVNVIKTGCFGLCALGPVVIVYPDGTFYSRVTPEDVKEIVELKPASSVCRELILCKVAVKPEQRPQVIAVADVFRAKIVDVSKDSLIIELTGNQAKLDAFIGLLEGLEVKELVRTGITGLARGSSELK